jgi:hypothetical protein
VPGLAPRPDVIMYNLCMHRSAPDQDVEEVRRLMAEHQLDHILVVLDDRLVSEADLRSDEGSWPKQVMRNEQPRFRLKIPRPYRL